MADAFGLAASIIGVIAFTLQLWTEAAEIRKGGATISVADCAREAARLQAHCDRVKTLQNTESDFAEAERIKAIASEAREVAEELSRRLAKCKLPPGQKGWRRYRDVITVLWHDRQMDAEAEMKRLNVLRDELQSDILVSMSRKVDISDLRNSQSFQKLDAATQALTTAMLEGQDSVEKAIRSLDVAAGQRHQQLMTELQKLGRMATTPGVSAHGGMNSTRRSREELIDDLRRRLFLSAVSRRHYAITPAHKKTFEWVFTGQKKTAESDTTLMEWITGSSGLYWVSGRAGAGKSSLMRFLDDDSRTKEAFQRWAGNRPLVLAAFYFWNSEAAGDTRLKSLVGLYRGIFYGLIRQNDAFAEILFPDEFLIGGSWDDNFPTLTDMAQAFERLARAKDLPAIVGLIIDGLDEYEASSSDQMAMAEVLCHAARSPNLKIVVSSRPEAAFETVFAKSTKLRLHELTMEDRRTYISDKLKAVPRFGEISTEAEQADVIDLVVERSEGIFLWVHLAVVALVQEIGLSMDVSRLKNVVNGIPGGNRELTQLFDHILRNRIPGDGRLLGFRLIHTLQYGYTLKVEMDRPVEEIVSEHPITAMLYSFFEEDVTNALTTPIAPIEKNKAISRIELASNLIRQYCAGLLELRYFKESMYPGSNGQEYVPLKDPEVHFLHKDVAIYLSQQDTSAFLERSLASVKATLQTNLMKCIIFMMKLYCGDSGEDQYFQTDRWNIWTFTELAMRIARTAEEYNLNTTEILLDEVDRVLSKLYDLLPFDSDVENSGKFFNSRGVTRGEWLYWAGHVPVLKRRILYNTIIQADTSSNMLSLAIELGLFRYVESKVHKYGAKIIEKPGLPLLSSACGIAPIHLDLNSPLRPETVKLLLDSGADPNEAFRKTTCWRNVLINDWHTICKSVHDYVQLGKVLELMLNAGADPFISLKWAVKENSWKSTTRQYSARLKQRVRYIFVDDIVQQPQLLRFDDAYIPSKEEVMQIREIGQALLKLVDEKRHLANKKASWGKRLLHDIKAWKGGHNNNM